jgi:hypothetical protein
MKRESLEYFIHDEPDAFRMELSGSLSGEGAQSVYQAWRTALSIIGQRRVIVDITCITSVDERGRALLRLWQQSQARIVAASVESRALVEPILGSLPPDPPVKLDFMQRIRTFFAERAVRAA